MRFLTSLCLSACLVLSACATIKAPTAAKEEDLPQPKLVESLPDEVGSFDYEGYRYFEVSSAGYAVRYSNPRKHRIADIYIYPVAKQNEELEHDDLVMGSTRATIQAIGDAVKQGIYSDFNVIGAATQARGFRTVARVEATYLRENLASYTLVYQTEYDGTLLKIRMSMPDNDSNRANGEWDEFANTMFNKLVEELDDERIAASGKKKATDS